MIADSCVSWAVFFVLAMVVCVRFFFYCVNLREKNKEQEIKINYDQDLIF